MTDIEIRKEIVKICKAMHAKGFIAGGDGNVSFLLNEKIYITPSGINKGFMCEEDVIIVDTKGNVVEGNKKPSLEIKLHLEVFNKRKDVKAVIHSHAPKCVAFSIAEKELPFDILPEVILTLGKIPTASYATPTTDEPPKSIEKLILNHDAIILSHHGTLTVGKSLMEAYNKLEKIEHLAEVAYVSSQLGNQIKLNIEQLNKLEKIKEELQSGKNY